MNQVNTTKSPDTTQAGPYNSSDIDLYFDFLCHSNNTETQIFTGFWLGADGKAPIKGLGVWGGTVTQIKEKYNELISQGVELPTFHVTLNVTSFQGRKSKHIQSVRVFCVDIDRKITREECIKLIDTYAPALLVLSSPNKYHLYWQADSTIKLDEWLSIQAGLAAVMDGDLNLAEVSHTIRVPGFPRRTKDGQEFCPRCVYKSAETVVWTPELWQEVVPGIVEKGVSALGERRAQRSINRAGGAKGSPDRLRAKAKGVKAGERNQFLYDSIYGYARDGNGDVSEESCIELGVRINGSFGEQLELDEVEKTARSAHERGIAARQERETKKQNLLNALAPAPELLKGLFQYQETPILKDNRFTDEAVAERVMQRFGKNIVDTGKAVYAFELRRKVWAPQMQKSAGILDLVKECSIDTIHDSRFLQELCCDARGNPSPDKVKQWQRHFMAYHTHQNIVRAVIQRKDLTPIDQERFDSRDNLFYCRNGVLDWVSGEFREARPEDYLLHQSKVEYRPGEDCPWWKNFIQEIFAENQTPEKMVLFLQELFGYSLSGSIDEQKIFIHYGGGSNGKSKVLLALNLLLSDYGALMGSSTLAKKKQPIDQELQRVGVKAEGKRTLIIDDVDTKSQWNESIVKNFTGPFLPIRRLYEEERDIPNRAKFHLGCNEAPEPESENYGILRRLCIIPYVRTFIPLPEKEKEIVLKIREELSGILNWAVEGCKRRLARGSIQYPEEVLLSIEEYRIEHFSVEELCFELFTQTDGSDDDWHELPELVNVVNQKLVEIGKAAKKISPDYLGKLFKRKFKSESKRISVGNTKVTVYKVKLLYQPKLGLICKIEQ